MLWIGSGLAVLLAAAFLAIGASYLARPLAATAGFGLSPPSGENVASWLRLKGTRDAVFGIVVLAAIIFGGYRLTAFVLMIAAFVPIGDMVVVLTAKGPIKNALGIHGLTAVLMLLASTMLLIETW